MRSLETRSTSVRARNTACPLGTGESHRGPVGRRRGSHQNGGVPEVRPRKVSSCSVAQWEERRVESRVQRGEQVRDRCYVQRLGLMKIPKGQGAARRHSVGTNTVDHAQSNGIVEKWSGECGNWRVG